MHHPVVASRSDGLWVVTCPECRRDGPAAAPIGIDMPVASFDVAEMIRQNHAGRGLHATARRIEPGRIDPGRIEPRQPPTR